MAELSWPMKPPAWSYSSISLYKTCPKKYYAERVSKEIPYTESEAQRYGTELHLGPRRAIIEVGDPIAASAQRDRSAGADPLLASIEQQLKSLLQRSSVHCRRYQPAVS